MPRQSETNGPRCIIYNSIESQSTFRDVRSVLKYLCFIIHQSGKEDKKIIIIMLHKIHIKPLFTVHTPRTLCYRNSHLMNLTRGTIPALANACILNGRVFKLRCTPTGWLRISRYMVQNIY